MNLPSCQLLHWEHERGTVPTTTPHQHPYFQIELCINGFIRVFTPDKKEELTSDEWILLPSGTQHHMIYSQDNLEYYSFKFTVENLPEQPPSEALKVSGDELTRWCISTLQRQHDAETRSYQEINSNRPILEAILLVMIQHALKPLAPRSDRPKLLTALAELVAGEGAWINVQNAAEKLQLSLSQLKYQYALAIRELPETEPHLTLKQYLDIQLMQLIDRYLYYSDLPLGEIAAQTKFNNIYTFSRFCRRMTGVAPSLRRHRM